MFYVPCTRMMTNVYSTYSRWRVYKRNSAGRWGNGAIVIKQFEFYMRVCINSVKCNIITEPNRYFNVLVTKRSLFFSLLFFKLNNYNILYDENHPYIRHYLRTRFAGFSNNYIDLSYNNVIKHWNKCVIVYKSFNRYYSYVA